MSKCCSLLLIHDHDCSSCAALHGPTLSPSLCLPWERRHAAPPHASQVSRVVGRRAAPPTRYRTVGAPARPEVGSGLGLLTSHASRHDSGRDIPDAPVCVPLPLSPLAVNRCYPVVVQCWFGCKRALTRFYYLQVGLARIVDPQCPTLVLF